SPEEMFNSSIDNLKKLSNKLEGENIQRLKELIDMPIRWVKIKEKNQIPGKKETYDLTIENHHNFITNHIISHNCVANDVKKGLYDLNDVSLLIEDEAHRCVKNYDYNFLAKKYQETSQHPLILGMTASPGSDKEKIKQICDNLSIKKVELRSRKSSDVKDYLQELEFESIKTDLPGEFWQIKRSLKKIFDSYITFLRDRKMLFKPATKINLINLQKEISQSLSRGNKSFNLYQGASACAQAIKIQHAIELIETQTVKGFNNYLKDLFEQARDKKSKGVEKLVSKPEFNFAYMQSSELLTKNREHPKIDLLLNLVIEEKQKNPETKIIIFTQFRDTASVIAQKLNQLNNRGISSKVFVGQTNKSNSKNKKNNSKQNNFNTGEGGLSQKEQKRIIQEFSRGEFNVLTATSIAEEGLDIPEVNSVVFYEPIPSAIRSIQRRGRTARLMKGKLFMLITKNTRDESFFYVSRSREKKMESVIGDIKEELESGQKNNTKEKQKTL
ncbi:MAG: helicase-related protein, partial [Minisyncoccales bacterium]